MCILVDVCKIFVQALYVSAYKMRDDIEPLMLAWDMNDFFEVEQELYLNQDTGCLYLDSDGIIVPYIIWNIA